MANCPEYIFCEYALAKIGAVRVPLAVLLSPQDHVYMMNEAECTTLIYHESMKQRVEGMIPDLKTVARFICVGDDTGPDQGHLLLSNLIDKHSPDPAPVDIDPEDLAGVPKESCCHTVHGFIPMSCKCSNLVLAGRRPSCSQPR